MSNYILVIKINCTSYLLFRVNNSCSAATIATRYHTMLPHDATTYQHYTIYYTLSPSGISVYLPMGIQLVASFDNQNIYSCIIRKFIPIYCHVFIGTFLDHQPEEYPKMFFLHKVKISHVAI